MRLIIGLGNPGEEYRCTRRNAGFLVADALLVKIRDSKRVHHFVGETLNFMNEAGSFVKM